MELLPGVVTFRQHPEMVLSPEQMVTYLISLEERVRLLRDIGVKLVAVLSFTPDLARLTAREFVTLLRKYLKMRGLVIGPDFALGQGRAGDAAALRRLGEEIGFYVEEVPPMVIQGEVVSSTAIRKALAQGDVIRVERLLGRQFSFSGKVIPGDERGRVLGFPTANLAIATDQALPAEGVYTIRAYIGGKTYQAVTNIGRRPTFGGDKRMVEVYLLDFNGDLYGKEIRIELLERLRGEEKFDTVEELKAQIMRDVERARVSLSS